MKNLIHEIHRRSLWQVLGIYLAGSWVALQVVEQLAEAATLPEWVRPLALILLIIGLPIVLATAFVQEGLSTREGEPPPQSLADIGEVPPGPPAASKGAASVFTWRNAIGGGVVALAVWGLVALGWVFLGGAGPAGVAPTQAEAADPAAALLPQGEERARSVAVLPFANLSADEENAFFADGVHESVLTQISKIGDLRVLSRASMLRYRDTDLSLEEIADEVAAGAILQGSVQRAGDRLRITASLTDPYSGDNLWAETFDGAVADIFDFQSTVALAVADRLEASLSPREERAIERPATGSTEALDFFLRGRFAYNAITNEGNEEAIRLFRLAIAEDSSFAEAWAGLGDGYLQRVQFHGYPIAWADSGRAAAERALELHPDLADAHKTLGFAASMDGRHSDARDAYLAAIDLVPSHSSGINNVGASYSSVGEWPAALEWFKRAYQLDPNSVLSRLNVGWAYAAAGDQESARQWMAQADVLTPDDPSVAWYYWHVDFLELDAATANDRLEGRMDRMTDAEARLYGALAVGAMYGRDAEAVRRHVAAARERMPEGGSLVNFADTRVAEAWAASRSGLTGRALEILSATADEYETQLERGADGWLTSYTLAQIAALRGAHDEAVASLVAARDAGFSLYQILDQDPIFDDIRDDPRFREIREVAEATAERLRARVAEQEREPVR